MSIIKNHALPYVQTITSHHKQNTMFYTFILISLAKEGRKNVTTEPRSYNVDNDFHFSSDAMLLKFLVNKCGQEYIVTYYHNILMALMHRHRRSLDIC